MILLLIQIKLYNIHIETEELDIESVPLQKTEDKTNLTHSAAKFFFFSFSFHLGYNHGWSMKKL